MSRVMRIVRHCGVVHCVVVVVVVVVLVVVLMMVFVPCDMSCEVYPLLSIAYPKQLSNFIVGWLNSFKVPWGSWGTLDEWVGATNWHPSGDGCYWRYLQMIFCSWPYKNELSGASKQWGGGEMIQFDEYLTNGF